MGTCWIDFGTGNTPIIGGALQDIAVGYMKIMPSENSLIRTSYVPGMVTVERGIAFDDN